MIMNQREIKKAISDLKRNIDDKALFCSPSFHDFIQTIVNTVTEKYKDRIKVHLIWQEENGTTAYTDGYNITVNMNTDAFCKGKNRYERCKNTVAMVLHECGHILFTDFQIANKIDNAFRINQKLLYLPDTVECQQMMNELNNDEELFKNIMKIRSELDNCLEDGYVDKKIVNLIRGYGVHLRELSIAHCSSMPTYKESMEKKYSKKSIYLNQILHYAKAGSIKADEDDLNEEIMVKVFHIIDFIDAYRDEDCPDKRAMLCNQILSMIYMDFKELDKKESKKDNSQGQGEQKTQSSGQQNSDGNANGNSQNTSADTNGENQKSESNKCSDTSSQSTDNQNNHSNENISSNGQKSTGDSGTVEQVEKPYGDLNLSDVLKNMPELTNSGSDVHKNPISQKANPAKNMGVQSKNEKHPTPSSAENKQNDLLNKQIENVLQQEAKKQVEKKQEKLIENSLQETLKNMEKDTNSLKGNLKKARSANGYVVRQTEIDIAEKMAMDKEMRPYVERVTKEMEKEIKDRQTGGIERGKYFGTRMNPSRLSTPEKKLFSRKIAPENFPDMAIAMLLDMSGSTRRDGRLDAERKTAYIIKSCCLKLNIPCAVYGFSTYGPTKITSFAEFSSIDGKDLERIATINTPSGCNRDGYALKFVSDRLNERPETSRLLIVLSDGKPSDYDSFEEAKLDIQETLHRYAGRKIEYISCAIGDDEDKIKSLYSEGMSRNREATFLNIKDLERLPKAFVKILKKKIM